MKSCNLNLPLDSELDFKYAAWSGGSSEADLGSSLRSFKLPERNES